MWEWHEWLEVPTSLRYDGGVVGQSKQSRQRPNDVVFQVEAFVFVVTPDIRPAQQDLLLTYEN